MLNFEEKKPDMSEGEKRERLELIQTLKDCFNIFKLALNEQTSRFERGEGGGSYLNNNNDISQGAGDASVTMATEYPQNRSARDLIDKSPRQQRQDTQNVLLED